MTEQMFEDLKKVWDKFGFDISHDTMARKVEGVLRKHILLAKKGVLDDINDFVLEQLDRIYPVSTRLVRCNQWNKIKQRHLSTSKEGTEFMFKVPSQSSDKGSKPSSLN